MVIFLFNSSWKNGGRSYQNLSNAATMVPMSGHDAIESKDGSV